MFLAAVYPLTERSAVNLSGKVFSIVKFLFLLGNVDYTFTFCLSHYITCICALCVTDQCFWDSIVRQRRTVLKQKTKAFIR